MIFHQYGFRCVHCGEVFEFEDLTRDHIEPKILGGGNEWTNIAPSCRPCNMSRSCDIIDPEWKSALVAKATDSYQAAMELLNALNWLKQKGLLNNAQHYSSDWPSYLRAG